MFQVRCVGALETNKKSTFKIKPNAIHTMYCKCDSFVTLFYWHHCQMKPTSKLANACWRAYLCFDCLQSQNKCKQNQTHTHKKTNIHLASIQSQWAINCWPFKVIAIFTYKQMGIVWLCGFLFKGRRRKNQQIHK